MQNPPPAASPRTVLLVGLAVLALHLALLRLAAPGAPRHAPARVVLALPAEILSPAPLPPPPPPPTNARHPAPSRLAVSPAAVNEVAAPADSAVSPADAETPAPSTVTRYLIPAPARLRYAVTGTARESAPDGDAELLWQHDGQRYDARLQAGSFARGWRVQTSRGRLGAQGLEPQRFSDRTRGEVAAHFEREQGRVVFSANVPTAALEEGAQDHLSALVQLAGLLAGQPERYRPGSVIALPAVGPREAVQWQFTVEGPQTLRLPGGELDTLKLTRPPTRPYDLRAEVWLAPALGWLPARIRLTRHNGDFIDQQWRASETP